MLYGGKKTWGAHSKSPVSNVKGEKNSEVVSGLLLIFQGFERQFSGNKRSLYCRVRIYLAPC